jgi:hypothetical protein
MRRRQFDGMDGQFSTVTKSASDERQWHRDQPIDEPSERQGSLKPMFPKAIQAGHQEHRAHSGSKSLYPKSGFVCGCGKTASVKMIQMPGRIQMKPPGTE